MSSLPLCSTLMMDYPGCENAKLPAHPEVLRNLLLQLDTHKFMGPSGIHPRIPKDLAMSSQGLIFERSWESLDIPVDWKLVNNVPIFKKGKKEDLRNYRSVSLPSVTGKVVGIILGGTEKHLKHNTVIGHGQHDFIRENPACQI